MNFCPQCGAKIENDESKFCAACGAPLSGGASPALSGSPSLPPLEEPGLPQRPKPAPAPTADSGGITGSFSSPFVKDALPAPGKEEPLFAPVFSEDKAGSLFEQAPPPPVQQGPLSGAPLPFDAEDLPAAPEKKPVSAFDIPLEDTAAPFASAEGTAKPLFAAGTGGPLSTPAPEASPAFSSQKNTAEPFLAAGLFGAATEESGPAPAEAPGLFGDTPAPEAGPALFAGAQPLPESEAPGLFGEAAAPPSGGLFAGAQPLPPEPEAFTQAPAARPSAPKAQPSAPKKDTHHQEIPRPQSLRQEAPAQSLRQSYPASAAATPAAPGFPPADSASLGASAAPAPADDLFTQEAAPAQRMPAAAPASILAESSSRAPAPRRRPAPPPPAHAGRGGARLLRNILIGILAGLVLLFGAILGFLYWQNRPSETIDTFIEALATRDYEALANTRNVSIVNVTNSSSEGWIALCDAFQDETTRMALAKELSRVSADPATSNFSYPSVRLVGSPYFLFIKTYRVHVTGVDVLVPAAAEGITLRLAAGDEFNDPAGVLDPQGMLYSGIMPGQYTATVTLPDGSSTQYGLSAFAIAQPNPVEGEAPADGGEAAPSFANLTISNCASDDALIFLNGQETPAKPSGGVVELQNVELGTTISIKAVVEGATQEASVIFSDPNTTTLSFGEYTQTEAPSSSAAAGEEISAEQAGTVLTSFYKSYLEAINAQSLSGIQNSTEANTAKLQARISSPANKANTYTFVSAEIDPASLTTKEENGVLVAQFTATCAFSYVPKEGEAAAETGSNKQAVRLVQQNGQWLVDSFTNA